MMSKLDFPLRGSSVNIVTKCGGALSEIIDRKFGCVATFHGVDFEAGGSTAQRRKPITPEKRCEFILPAGVKVSVWKADLTNFPADAVVNAANERLQHYGGLACALSAAGGPQIQQESDDYIKKRGPLKTGDAVALDSGNLRCKKIIHAVGPELPVNPSKYEVSKARPMLEKAIRHIFDRAEDCYLAKVAIPAISSGLFHFPLSDCADTIVSTVKYIYTNPSSQRNLPKEVFFVNNDEPTVMEMERACHQILPPHQSAAYSQAASRNTRASAKTSPPVQIQIQIGNVLLTLKKDKIEEQKTDVIVNTASQGKDLNMGEISKSILHKAGYEMQKEIKNARMEGHLIRTKSYRLRCKEVYHTFCIEKHLDPAAQQVLYRSVLDCLYTVGASKHNSISFPAIGTGALGFSKTESAQIMLNAVINFAQNVQKKLDVFFVIFPSDHETFQAFESQISQYQQWVSRISSPPGPDFKGFEGPSSSFDQERASHHSSPPAAAEASRPQISLSGSSDESTREAEKWLSDLLCNTSGSVKIFNNFLLHFSEEDHLKLSLLSEKGVHIEEFFSQGHACITIDGRSREDVVVAALKVEEMLCKIQKEFVSEEKHELWLMLDVKVSVERQTADPSDRSFSEFKRTFKDQALCITKVDTVNNPALELLFNLKKKQLGCSTSKIMFQRIPAQFCEMISHIGFHAECAPPEDPKYGEGIYFAGTVKKAMELWKEDNEEFLYFVLADVLIGKSVSGERGLIVPPVRQTPDILFDSVTGGSDVAVVFSGYQALPKFIIICSKNVSAF